MTYPRLIERRSIERTAFSLISSTSTAYEWRHPELPIFQVPLELPPQQAKLFLIPSTFDDELDSDEQPIPTAKSELPDITSWCSSFVISLIEIWGGRRQPAQLITRCHRAIYFQLLKRAGTWSELPKLRNIHIQEVFDGLCEVTITVRIKDRMQAIAMRIEGVDGRWLCTALDVVQ